MRRVSLLIFVIFFLVSCSSSPRKTVLDASSPDRPDWADSNKVSWKDDDKIFFRGSYVVGGNERANACIDLAKLDIKEALITEIQEELKGALDSAQDSIREDAEIILTKSRSLRYHGVVTGLRMTSTYWEKYALETGGEKVSCYVLGEINEKEYTMTKRNVVDRITKANPKLKEAVQKKQVEFFQDAKE